VGCNCEDAGSPLSQTNRRLRLWSPSASFSGNQSPPASSLGQAGGKGKLQQDAVHLWILRSIVRNHGSTDSGVVSRADGRRGCEFPPQTRLFLVWPRKPRWRVFATTLNTASPGGQTGLLEHWRAISALEAAVSTPPPVDDHRGTEPSPACSGCTSMTTPAAAAASLALVDAAAEMVLPWLAPNEPGANGFAAGIARQAL